LFLAIIGWSLGACEAPTTNNTDDGESVAATTFARSFGNSKADAMVSLEADASGDLWVLGNFRDEPISNLLPDLEVRPWLSRLDGSGNPRWEVSPQSGPGRSRVSWKFGQATPDGGGIFVGDLESREGRNIFLQMQDGNGDIVWELQLDGTAHWQRNGMSFEPSRPGSDETLAAVHGRPDYGWWVIADSQAVGFDAGSAASFGAPNVLIWFVSPNGNLVDGSPQFFGSVDLTRRGSEENATDAVATSHAASTSYPGGPLRTPDAMLGMLVRSVSTARNVDQVTLVSIFRANNGSIVTSQGSRPVTDIESLVRPSEQLVAHLDTDRGTFLEPHNLLHLRGQAVLDRDLFYRDIRLSKFSTELGPEWTLTLPNSIADRVTSVASTSWVVTKPTTGVIFADSQIWVGGRDRRNGEYVPLLWKISDDGNIEEECVLDSIVDGYRAVNVVALSAVTRESRLRVLMQSEPSGDGLGVEALLEVTVNRSCIVIAGESRVYVADTDSLKSALSLFSSRAEYTNLENLTQPGGPMLEALSISDGRKILHFDRATGAPLATVADRDVGTRSAIPVDMAVVKAPSARVESQVVLTGAAGQLQGFDAAGQPLYNLAIPALSSSPLRDPVLDSNGSLWLIGGKSLLQLDASLNASKTLLSPCSLRPAEERVPGSSCSGPEFLATDDGSVGNNQLHALGRVTLRSTTQQPSHRYFRATFDTQQPGVATIRFLPPEFDDFVFSNAELPGDGVSVTLDSINGGADDVMLINAFLRPAQLYLPDIAAGRTRLSRRLHHYGTTDETRWALDIASLSVRDARLAHDGGVVLLMVAGGSNHQLDERSAEYRGFDRNLGIMKLTAEGNVQWLRIYGTAADDLPVSLTRTPNGYAVAAVSRGVDAVTPGSQDLFILKLGIDGHIAADAAGTEFCQAGITDLSGSIAYNRLLTDIGGDLRKQPLARLVGSDISWTPSELQTVSLPLERSALSSANSARQCAGAATNVQEDPFTTDQVFSNPPSAAFVVTPSGQTTLGTPLTFDASASTDDVGVVSWEWDLGDDGAIDASGEVVTLTPAAVGQTVVRLRVTDADGQSDEVTRAVDVIGTGTTTFTLRVVLNGPGSVDIMPLAVSLPNDIACDGNECFVFDIATGTVLTLSAFGSTPAMFLGWSSTECDTVSNASCVLTMTSDRSVTAGFQ
jgi:hypothetical protein